MEHPISIQMKSDNLHGDLAILVLIDDLNDIVDKDFKVSLGNTHFLEIFSQLLPIQEPISILIYSFKLFLELILDVIVLSSLLDSLLCGVWVGESFSHGGEGIHDGNLVAGCGSSRNESIVIHLYLILLFTMIDDNLIATVKGKLWSESLLVY